MKLKRKSNLLVAGSVILTASTAVRFADVLGSCPARALSDLADAETAGSQQAARLSHSDGQDQLARATV